MPLPEKRLIAQLSRIVSAAGGRSRNLRIIAKGIGDDCAVLHFPAGHDVLVTTDFSLEGVHFRREWHSPESVGYRCLVRGLSDIAAMGGTPVAAFLSLALPRDLQQSWVDRFIRGLLRLGKRYRVTLAGGDTAESQRGVLADIIVVGTVPKGRAVLRSGARPGDRIFVSGELGGSAAAVRHLQSGAKSNLGAYWRHFSPDPRVELGRLLREKKLASAMIDTSDGLSTDLAHLCEESGVGAELDSKRIPRARVGKPARPVDLELALHGGEDYELLFTARPGKAIPNKIAGVGITEIGRIIRGKRIHLREADGRIHDLQPRGWEHFQ